MTPLFLTAVTVAAHAAEPRLTHHVAPSEAEGRTLAWSTYEPRGWDGTTPLPLVVFLHGLGDDERAFDRHPAAWRALDRWIAERRLPPFLMVVPRGERGLWRNWDDGTHRWADWVWDEVIPAARARWPVTGVHLAGISMGGAGALSLGLDHLDAVASITALSAPIPDADTALASLARGGPPRLALARIFGPPDRERITAANAHTRLAGPADLGGATLVVGHGEVEVFGVARTSRGFHEHLDTAGVPHTYLVHTGGHRWADWARALPVALCLQLGGTGCADAARGVRVRAAGQATASAEGSRP